MKWMQNKSLLYFRLIVSLALLSCISPFVDIPAAKTTTVAAPLVSPVLPPAQDAPRLVIWKSHYTLTLYRGDVPVKTYRTTFGKGFREGDKQMVGDRRTPEGEFYICTMNRSKRFYKFMGLSYPGLKHAEYGLQSNLISQREYLLIKKAIDERQPPPWDTRLGGAVGIHGMTLGGSLEPGNIVSMNWTDGCIALENSDIDEIFSIVSLGTPVTILP